MKTIPISEARRRWGAVAAAALKAPVLLTRHGRAWVLVVPVADRLLELLGEHEAEGLRDAGRRLCRVAADARAGAILVVVVRRRARVAIMPSGDVLESVTKLQAMN